MSERTMTLLDGTIVRKGDKVRAKGECGGFRVCHVLEILSGGVDKAILTKRCKNPRRELLFGTVIRSRYQIKPWRPTPEKERGKP